MTARGARIFAVVVVGAVVCFAAWQWVMPADFASVRGLNPRAAWEWRSAVGLAPAPVVVSLAWYRMVFRALVVAAWVAYAGLLWFVARGGRRGRGWTWPLAIPLIAVLAVAVPACLSTDLFAYVGYARLAVVHGLNPHLHTQVALISLADPTAPYLRWPIASPYGPLWTLASVIVVYLSRALFGGGSAVGAILIPVIALKLLAGAGLLGAATAARAIVRRTDPQRAQAVFVLVVLNPLLLIEGPVNGHNDLVMVALLLAGLAALAMGRAATAALSIGISGAVKLVPLLVVPWLAMLAGRAAGSKGASRVAAIGVTIVLALIPVVVAFVPLWEGPDTLGGIVQRWEKSDPSLAAGATVRSERDHPVSVPPAVNPSEGSNPAGTLWTSVRTGLRALSRVWPALLVYLWATLAIALGQGDPAYRVATLWSFVAISILCFAAGLWCSWYLAWLWPAVVLRFTRPHVLLAAFAVPFSLLLMLAYATPPG